MDVNIDFLGNNGSSQGDVAGLITNGRMDSGSLRPFVCNTPGQNFGKSFCTVYIGGDKKKKTSYSTIQVNAGTLRPNEWRQLDEAIMPISQSRLVGVQDLISRNLVYNLGNAMGTTVLEYHDISTAMEADVSMDGVTRGQGDRPVYGTKYLPIPIIHVDYEINTRTLNASRSLGNPLDTTSAEYAARAVASKLENMLFTDTDYSFGGGSIKSYVNYGDRNQVSLATSWTDSTITGEKIVDVVSEMKQASLDAKHYGPWVLYIPTNYETKMDEDYSSSKGSNTTRERILKLAGITDIKVVDTLADDNVLLVQMTPDVVRLVNGMSITNVEWTSPDKFINKYKVLAIQVPQIRSDQDGNCGIVHLA